MKMRKRLDGGLKKIVLIFLFFFISFRNVLCSEILDHETENFVYELIENISQVNEINKQINFKIISNKEINAFVDQNNTIYLNSSIIEYSEDYVSLLNILAHEIGHIELNHILQRKKNIESTKKYQNLSLLSVIAGTAITQRLDLLQGNIVSNAALSNRYINFTKEQEVEADIFALETLKLLNTNSDSIIKLLEIIELKLDEKGFSKENQRISSHPYIEDRILLIKHFNNNKKNNLDIKLNQRFNFIKAKFIGYSDNNEVLKNLEEPYKTYAESIQLSRNGYLHMSLKSLNGLINKYSDSFLLETKADILYSNGFTKEALKFYRKNLDYYPKNYYAQIRIFQNTDISNLSSDKVHEIFEKNKALLLKYNNNKNILFKYLELAKNLNKTNWIEFLTFYLSVNINDKTFNEKLNLFKKSNDKDLITLINYIQKVI